MTSERVGHSICKWSYEEALYKHEVYYVFYYDILDYDGSQTESRTKETINQHGFIYGLWA